MEKNKYYLIVNPHGGGGKGLAIKDKVLPIFEKSNSDMTIIETTHSGHAQELAQSLDLNGYAGFLPIGGDGTMHEVVNGILSRADNKRIPIGLITGGTGNSFMHDLDLLDPIEAAKVVVNGKIQSIDIASLRMSDTQTYCFNIVGWGLVTDANIKAEYIRWLGESRYTISAAIEVIFKKKRFAKVAIDDKIIEGDILFVIICNTKHTGKGMKIAPKAVLNDGLLDVVLVRDANRFTLLKLLPKVFDGSHIHHPKLEYYHAKEISLEAKIDSPLNLDGETAGSTPFTVSIIHNALDIFIS